MNQTAQQRTQHLLREQGGQKAYEAYCEIMPECWTWKDKDPVTQEAWMHVYEVLQDPGNAIPELPHRSIVSETQLL